MILLTPVSAAEVLAIVLCPDRVFGTEPGTAEVMRKVKQAVIRRYRAARRD